MSDAPALVDGDRPRRPGEGEPRSALGRSPLRQAPVVSSNGGVLGVMASVEARLLAAGVEFVEPRRSAPVEPVRAETVVEAPVFVEPDVSMSEPSGQDDEPLSISSLGMDRGGGGGSIAERLAALTRASGMGRGDDYRTDGS